MQKTIHIKQKALRHSLYSNPLLHEAENLIPLILFSASVLRYEYLLVKSYYWNDLTV